jgi:hypothetical protein
LDHRWTRRTFVRTILNASGALGIPRDLFPLADPGKVFSLRLSGERPIDVPANFIGLGYEMLSVATPDLLAPNNGRYVELVRGLGPKGVIRVGGIVADYTRYLAEGTPLNDCKNTVITRASLGQFAAFLKAVGWKAMWSVNFAQGTVQEAVEEARAVSNALGSSLLALELGNEVENYATGRTFRKSPYTYESFLKEFDGWRAAIHQAVPKVQFAGPDTAQSVDWVERMAKDAHGRVDILTTHYYRNGQSRGSMEQLLGPDPRLHDVLVRLAAASRQSGIPWRMCEMNSFSGGGRPGVSDTLAGALWTLNIMLSLASKGCAGVNLETGVNQLGFVSCYSPIQDDGKGLNSAGVPYYGMLAFATAFSGCGQVLPLAARAPGEGISVYVVGAAGKPRSIVVVNMSPADARISVAGIGVERGSVLRLTGPAADSKTGVAFGGSFVDSAGRWKPGSRERLRNGNLVVERMSASVVLTDESAVIRGRYH